ncbi:MAG: hypothetical protein ACRCS7_05160, partial [Tannerellaceae bacterium]
LNSVFFYKIRGLSRSQRILITKMLQEKWLTDIKIPYRELFAPFLAMSTYHTIYLHFKRKQTSK